jgi:hypothetical protein
MQAWTASSRGSKTMDDDVGLIGSLVATLQPDDMWTSAINAIYPAHVHIPYTLLQILSVSVFEKTLISCALQPDTNRTIAPQSGNQLILFDF